MLKVGDKAPDFTLPSVNGHLVSLKDFRGKKVVLYFYPEDDTPGCTREACSFQDNFSTIKKRGAVVLGVSADSVDSHKKFAKKYDLTFPLLSDESKEVLKAYGVWKRKTLFGIKFRGIVRTTFVIDDQGRIRHIFPRVLVNGHTDKVLEVLDSLDKKE